MFAIEIADFRAEGVTLTAATDPGFDSRAQEILSGYAAPVLELKPYLAIVANLNPRTVVAYTLEWSLTLGNESTEVSYTQLKFPDAVAGTGNGLAVLQGRELRPGEQRVVGMGFEAWPVEYLESYRRFGQAGMARLGDVRGFKIALDGVIFDDGVLLGPDASGLAEHFIYYVQAKQQVYRDVVVGLENDERADEVFAPLRRRLAAQPNPADPFDAYPHQAAAEALGWRDRILLEIFRRALRREPFTIHRA